MTVILDQTSLRDLATMTDDMGVLSVYATADPRDRSASPTWQLAVGNAITALRNDVASNGDRQRKAAVLARLEKLEPEIDRVLGTAGSGVGRALFAPVSSDEVHTVSVQTPLEDCAVLERRPYLRPLAAVLTTDGPAGVVAVSREGARVLDLRFGVPRELARFTFELDNEDWRPSRSAPSQPGISGRASGVYDRFDRRVEERLLRYLQSVRPRIRDMADEHGWSTVVVAGSTRLLDVVRKGLAAGNGHRDIILLDRVVEALSPTEVAAVVRPELRAARVRRCRALAEQARDAAMSGGQGTAGLSDTLGALRENRINHLLLDGARQLRGCRGPDGGYYPQSETPPGAGADAMTEEGDLGERMIELGLISGAEVTVLPPEAADVLTEDDGVAALLRW
ncbi:MAG: VLRF1 family aeRF1-type release factor [Nocardiopsaceae bacterium]|nr:VLRF1 family aeRF1-type release factor [Nocardiopsaceae bacterium]